MIWIVTAVLVLVMAYAGLNLLISRDMGEGGILPYVLLLLGSSGMLYVAWMHPPHVTFG